MCIRDSPGSEYSLCELASDCADCGSRLGAGGDPGGGIYASAGSLIIESATFEDNSALSAGCDLYLTSGVDDAELFNTTFRSSGESACGTSTMALLENKARFRCALGE